MQNSGANDFRLVAGQQDKDIVFMGNDGGSSITALSLDMSNAGRAFFNVGASFSGDVAMADNNKTKYGQGEDLIVYSDGTNGEIEAPNGNLTLDVAGDITLDADGGDIRFKDGGTHIGSLYNSSNNFAIYSAVNNADLLLQGQDGGSTITALTLDMSAAGAATFNSTVTSTGLTATGANTSAATYATFQRSDTAVSARIRYDGSTTTFFGTSTNHPLAFETNGTEAMRIDSSGNVGLGVTPNANWSSSYRAIDAFGGATFQFEANSTRQGQNFYGYPWKYKATRTATSIAHTAGGDISFQVAPSGTADSAITWSQAMLIKNSGKVGIGTSSPNLKLHVEENADAWVGEFKNVRSAGGYGLRVDMTAGASATDTRFALGVYTPGNTGLFVKNNGNVGIGLTNQAHLLDILKTGSGDATINIKSTTGGDPNIIFNSAAANRSGLLKFQDNGTNVGRIEYVHNGDRIDFQAGSATGATMSVVNGKLLVGSTTTDASSSEKFLVKSTGGQHSRFVNSSDTYSTVYIKNTSTTANTNQPFLTFQDTGGNRGNFGLRYSTAQLVIQGHGGVGIAAGTGGISQDPDLFVNSIGNVGIGTSSPVNNGTNSQGLTINGTGNYQNLALQHNGTTQFLMYLNGSSGTFLNQVTADPIMFLTSDTERMRILAGGNVGIGTNNPSYLVHAQNSTATGQSVVATSGNGQFIMAIGSQNSPGVAQEAFVGTLSDTRFKIKVNNTVKGSWTDNGLAIGTQSSAYTNLDVAGQIAMSIGNAHAVFSSDTSGKIFIKANENCVNAATAIHMQMPIISGSGSLEDKLVINHSDITAYEHFLPSSDNTYDLGTATKRWRNIYTGDLHLSNESQKKGNDVDGTKGNWTVQEGEENLYLINNKTGKKYKFALEEIE